MANDRWPWVRADAVLTGDLLADFGAPGGARGVVEVVEVVPLGGGRVRLGFDNGESETLPADATVAVVNAYRRRLGVEFAAEAVLGGV